MNEVIQDQIRLPLKLAVGVVSQGIRIRIGRALVTLTGVVCGIAFLMSVLTGMALKKGLQHEDEIRLESSRMLNFLTAETGAVRGKTFGVVACGEVSEAEERLLVRIAQDIPQSLRIADAAEGDWDSQRVTGARVERVPLEKAVAGALAVLVIGDAGPSEAVVSSLAAAKPRLIAFTGNSARRDLPQAIKVLSLAHLQTAAENARIQKEERKNRFRNVWMVAISLLVTAMGISNAMLMSVTERFREIGTMKCLGALSSFVRTLFLIESLFLGVSGGVLGTLLGFFFSCVAYSVTYGFGLTTQCAVSQRAVLGVDFAIAFLAGSALAVLAAIYPAAVAARMVPADALKSNV